MWYKSSSKVKKTKKKQKEINRGNQLMYWLAAGGYFISPTATELDGLKIFKSMLSLTNFPFKLIGI